MQTKKKNRRVKSLRRKGGSIIGMAEIWNIAKKAGVLPEKQRKRRHKVIVM